MNWNDPVLDLLLILILLAVCCAVEMAGRK